MKQATINAGADVKAVRNIGRIKRLQEAITKAERKGNAERKASLQAELDQRLESARELRNSLDEIDGINS